ncbi:hypothetical protein I4U23_010530 [Adineta vaga]|nr:hypothetical protein I4U23_010530 [Adineta vaga]
MFKAAVIIAVALFALAQATTPVTEEPMTCSAVPTCYSRFAGMYYLHMTSPKHSWYMILTMRADGSYTWSGNDQTGFKQLEASELFFQPRGDLNGKWRCDAKQISSIEMKDFGFMFSTVKSPESMALNHNIIRLNMENFKQITGTFQFRTYKLETTELAEAAMMEGDKYTNLSRDIVGEMFDFSVKGYRLDRFC